MIVKSSGRKNKCRKTISIISIIVVVIIGGVTFLSYSYIKQEKIFREESRRRDEEQEEERRRINELEERYATYLTLEEINNMYNPTEFQMEQKNLTTENLPIERSKLNKLRDEYIKSLDSKTLKLYVRLADIYSRNGHRIADFWIINNRNNDIMKYFRYQYEEKNIITKHIYDDIKFIFYDDDKIITDVLVYDRLDIVADVINISKADNKYTIISKIIELEKNYGETNNTYDRYVYRSPDERF
jgi:flagellar basal body-associated protein FliL